LQDLVRELVKRVDAAFGRAPACDERPSTVRYAEPIPLVARRRPPSLPLPSNENTASCVDATRADGTARPGRADLLVAVDEHGQRAVILEAELVQHRHRVQDERDALLVVGDAEPYARSPSTRNGWSLSIPRR
jgi:hypothetical protein